MPKAKDSPQFVAPSQLPQSENVNESIACAIQSFLLNDDNDVIIESVIQPVACSEEEAETLGLARYLREDCLLLRGSLGTTPIVVIVPVYAQRRMKQRDILDEELLELLARPKSSHSHGKKRGHHEIAHRIDRRVLRVVYTYKSADVVSVVTVYQE